MRAEVARHFGGTPFDEKYLEMPIERLYILWSEARRHNRKEDERLVQQLKYQDTLARFIGMISNPEAYDKFLKHEKMDEFKEELTPEQAKREFETIKEMGLEFLQAIYPERPEEDTGLVDPEIERYFDGAGLDEFRQQMTEDVLHTNDLLKEIVEEGDE